jgi:hypothetical protein
VNLYDFAVGEINFVIFFDPVEAIIFIFVTLPLAKGAQVTVAVVGVVATATFVGLATGVRALASIPKTPIIRDASKTEADAFLVDFIFFT